MSRTYANGATNPSTFTLRALEDLLADLSSLPEPEYMLVCPDGRVFKGRDPWRLAGASGAVPDILKMPINLPPP